MYQGIDLDEPPRRKAAYKVSYGQTLKVATLNVCSLIKPTMHIQLENYMSDRDISLLCIQETKVALSTQYVVGDLLYVLHGNGGDTQEFSGVGMVLRGDIRRHVTGFEFGADGRILVIGLDLAPRCLFIVTGHAPRSRRPEQERVTFWDEMTKVVDRYQTKGPTLLIGDFNARIHGRRQGEHEVIGPHIFGMGIDYVIRQVWEQGGRTNREMMVELCMAHGLRVMNTWFRKPQERQVTYMPPGTERLPGRGEIWDPATFAQLDLCIAPDRWKGMVKDVESITWAGVNSDHFPLEVTLRLRLGNRRGQEGGQERPKYDFGALTEEARADLASRTTEWPAEVAAAATVNDAWTGLQVGATKAMADCVPKAPKRARRAWITEETLEMVEHRKALAGQGLILDARALDKMIRARAREDKLAWITRGLEEKFWEPIKECTRKQKPRVVTLRAQGGGDGQEPAPATPAQIYADYLGKVQWGVASEGGGGETGAERGWGTSRIGRPNVNIDTERITMGELDAAIKKAKKGRAPGLDNVPAEFWANIGDGRQALLDFFNRCWTEESFPDQWRESLVVGIFKAGKADDPANYRPISLLITAYKLFGRIIAGRLESGLSDNLRSTQYGFRKGRSTSEPMFILRRLQDLVHAKKNHALHLVFLDWSKAFDKVDTRCLPTVLRRFGVDEKMIRVVEALVGDPLFKVSMGGEYSEMGGQGTGIRQGCTLSPFLFTLILSAVMQDAEARVRGEHELLTTPTFSVVDLEYADDTVLISRTAEIAGKLLQYTEEEAAKYGLLINRKKTLRLAYNSEEPVFYSDGDPVPRANNVLYLGAILNDWGDPGAEINVRLNKATRLCNALRPIWATKSLERKVALTVLRSCVFSALLYGLHTLYCPKSLENKLDAFQIKCVRRALGIRTTYASKLLGEEPVTNYEVATRAGVKPLSIELRKMRYQLLGHILRRGGDDPARAATYDRYAQVKALSGTNRWGGTRKHWATEVMKEAAGELEAQRWLAPPGRGGAVGHVNARVASVALNREAWQQWIKVWYKSGAWMDAPWWGRASADTGAVQAPLAIPHSRM